LMNPCPSGTVTPSEVRPWFGTVFSGLRYTFVVVKSALFLFRTRLGF
jgi:hypothetical protein